VENIQEGSKRTGEGLAEALLLCFWHCKTAAFFYLFVRFLKVAELYRARVYMANPINTATILEMHCMLCTTRCHTDNFYIIQSIVLQCVAVHSAVARFENKKIHHSRRY
jgi:hypothetical protein